MDISKQLRKIASRLANKIAKEDYEPTNKKLWQRALAEARKRYKVYPSAYANAFASKWYKQEGGKWKKKKKKSKKSSELAANLRDWFKEEWVDIGSKEKGKHPECGRSTAKGESKRKYPKCVPKSKAKQMSKKEKEDAAKRKRKDVKKQKDKSKPTWTPTKKKN